ncbi:MAG TPA: diguanylate cyclase [Burkholderiales bacterium]|jgi:diguanylate cyclase (GGDEF)-like protein/PAS domain S-box-containing protein
MQTPAAMSLLIVDDDEMNRYTLARRLRRDGYDRVAMAGNGVEALAAMRQDSFDLILLDIMMPELDGFGVLEAMRADNNLKSMPVIVISASDDTVNFVRAIELGAVDYLTKPFDAVLLRARVRSCLERRSLQSDLESALAETRAVLDISPVATFFIKHGNVVWMNTMGEQLLGYKSTEMIGKPTDYLYLNPEDYAHLTAKAEGVIKTGAVFRADVHMKRRDGRLILARCAAKAIAPWDLTRGVVWVMEDVTEQRADAARIAFLAHHDQLTGMPNRILLADRLRVALAHAIRNKVSCGVMFMDLDKFKNINDTLGHAIGDELLIEVARRLKACVRDSDTVARIGGDEFVAVLPGIRTIEDAEVVARKIQIALTAPYRLSGHDVSTSPSIGISLFPSDALEADTLVKYADEAMYEAKQAGRNGYKFYKKQA